MVLLYTFQKLILVARVKVCFSKHCINKMSVDLTHYSLPLVQIHTHTPDVYISGVLWTAGTGRGSHMAFTARNVPCNTSTHTTSINLSGARSTECVGHVSVDLKWSSTVVEWMCSSVQRSSTAALKTKKPVTHQSPDHSMSYSLCTHLQCNYSTT